MNIILFIATLIVSFFAVQIGAIAFHLTGLEWSLAKFQALSCFTGTGFTTRESELVTVNPRRRKIATALIILGHAGFVALVATFANSISPNVIVPEFEIPIIHKMLPPQIIPWMRLTIIVIAAWVVFRVFTSSRVVRKLTDTITAQITKRKLVKPVNFQELMVSTGGYGISQIEVCENSPILGKTLKDTKLRQKDINVLVLDREGTTIPNPPADIQFQLRDRLTCFGKLEIIRKTVCTLAEQTV